MCTRARCIHPASVAALCCVYANLGWRGLMMSMAPPQPLHLLPSLPLQASNAERPNSLLSTSSGFKSHVAEGGGGVSWPSCPGPGSEGVHRQRRVQALMSTVCFLGSRAGQGQDQPRPAAPANCCCCCCCCCCRRCCWPWLSFQCVADRSAPRWTPRGSQSCDTGRGPLCCWPLHEGKPT